MADSIDFRELNSAIAELNRLLISLGPALFEFRDAIAERATKEVENFTAATKEATTELKTETTAGKENKKAKDDNTKATKELTDEQRAQTQRQREVNQILEPYKKTLKDAEHAQAQAQREQRNLTAAFRGLGSSVIADVALGVQRFTQTKTAIQLEKARIQSYVQEQSIAQQDLASKQQVLEAKRKEYESLMKQAGAGEKSKEMQSKIDQAARAYDVAAKEASDTSDKIDRLGEAAKDADANIRTLKTDKFVGVLTGTSNFLGKLGGNIKDLGYGLRDFQRRVGISAGQLAKLTFTDTGKAINLIKGKWQEMVGARGQDYFDRMIEARDVFGDEFGGTLTGAAAGKLASQARSMGVTVGELAKARRGFMTLAVNDLKGATEMQGKFVAEFKKKGLNTKDAFEAVSKYTDIMARNGTRFAASFAKAAADAKKIGVDLKKVDAFGDSLISDYEGFLEKFANLNAMGFQFDPSRLAEISESGDTGALMNEIRSQLAASGKDLTNLTRSQQIQLANAFNMNVDELTRMAAPKPEEGTKADAAGAAGESVARGLERIDKATLNLPDDFTAAGYAAQFLGKALEMATPIIIGFSFVTGKLKDLFAARAAAGAATTVAQTAAGETGKSAISGLTQDAKGKWRDAKGRFAKAPASLAAGGGDAAKGMAAAGPAAQLGGVGPGIGGTLKSLAMGIAAFGNPAVVYGAAVLIGTIAVGIVAIGASLAAVIWLMGKALPSFAKGLTFFNEVKGTNLMAIGVAMLALGGGLMMFGSAMIAMGAASPIVIAGAAAMTIAGAAILVLAKIGTVVFKGLALSLQEFNKIDGSNLIKTGLAFLPLSLGLFALGKALPALAIGGVISKVLSAVSGDKEGAITKISKVLSDFGNISIDGTKVKANADAITAFGTSMKTLSGLGGGWFRDDLQETFDKIAKLNFDGLMNGLDGFNKLEVQNPKTLTAKGEAFKSFGEAMAAVGSIADGGFLEKGLDEKLKSWPAPESFTGLYTSYKDFDAKTGTVKDAGNFKTKAEAFKSFGEAMKLVAEIAGGEWLKDDLNDKLAIWKTVDITAITDKLIQFSKLPITDEKAIEGKARGLGAFVEAIGKMNDIEEMEISQASMDVVNNGFKKFIENTKDAAPSKILETAKGVSAVSEAFAKYNSSKIDQADKQVKNFTTSITGLQSALSTIGTSLTSVANALASLQTNKLDKIKELFTPQFTAAFTASIMALANIYQGKKVDAGAITRGRDVVSNSGYGERTLVTPSGPIALHNSDTVVAYANDMISNDGVQLLSKGALLNNQSKQQNVVVDLTRLEQKLEAMVRAIGSMQVNLDGNKVGNLVASNVASSTQVGILSR